MKIDLIVAENTYSTTAHFAASLQEALCGLGASAELLELNEKKGPTTLAKLKQDPPDFTCSFSNIHHNQKPFGEITGRPHISLLLDPVIYSLYHLTSPLSWVGCVDKNDLEFLQGFGFTQVFFCPHAADPRFLTSPETSRSLEALFFGTCIDFEAIEAKWRVRYGKMVHDLLLAAAERVLSSETTSLVQILASLGVTEENLPLYHHEVDLYTRGRDRVELLRSANPSTLHIYGEGPWRKYLPKAHLHAPLPFAETLPLMQQAKIVYNSSPRFKKGTHERVLYGLLCGAAVVTGDTTLTTPGTSQYTYGTWEPAPLPTSSQIEEGQKEILAHHTWNTRAQTLLSQDVLP
ncbi:MAG: hypothetical protein K940chlam9_00917 [Chlamydiae bacterium]|nr:hypothetical protein [Chlamydiota bacterium]